MSNQDYYNQLQAETGALRQRAEQAEYDAIVNGIAAAQSDAESAQQALQEYWRVGDLTGAGDAQRRLSRAEARLVQLENGKDAWEVRSTSQPTYVQPTQPQQVPQTPEQIVAGMRQLTQKERDWLLAPARRHFVTDPNKVTRLQAAFMEAQEKGLTRDSDAYFAHFDDRVGGNAYGLTKAQQDHARYAGVEESEYAKQVRKMYELKHNSDALYGSMGR